MVLPTQPNDGDASPGSRSAAPGLEVTSIAAFAVAGHLFLAWAVFEGGWRTYDPKALPGLLIAIGLWIAGLVRGQRPLPERAGVWALRGTWLIALLPAIIGLKQIPGEYLRADEASVWPSYLLHGCAVLILLSYLPQLAGRAPPIRPLRRARIVTLFVVAAAIGAWLIVVTPEPPIDVWVIRQQGAELLLSGESPYAGGIHALDTNTHGRYIEHYVYPPLNLVVTTAAHALSGETRWAQWASMIAGGFLVLAIARRRATPGHPWPELLAAALLFHPQALRVLPLAWGEPLALPFLAGAVWLLDGGRRMAAWVVLGLLISMKQYFLLYLPFFALLPGVGLAGVLVAVATLAATLAPFVLWKPAGLWDGLIVHHLENPFRPESLSLTSFLAKHGVVLPAWTGFLGAAAFGLTALRLPRKMDTLLLAATLALAVFFVFGRQAFQNYYYLVGATALVVAATAERQGAAAHEAAR